MITTRLQSASQRTTAPVEARFLPRSPAMVADDAAWAERPLHAVVEHVIDAYHRVVDTLIVEAEHELRALAADPADAIAELHALRAELVAHMAKEEAVLFPWILSARARTAAAPIRAMQLEHRDTLTRLDELRRRATLAIGGTPSPRLDALEASARALIQLEDEIVFPRALAGA